MKNKNHFYQWLPLIFLIIADIYAYTSIADWNFSKYAITCLLNGAIVFFLAISIVGRHWAFPVTTLKYDIYIIGAFLMLIGITGVYEFIILGIIPIADIPRYVYETRTVEHEEYSISKIKTWHIFLEVMILLFALIYTTVVVIKEMDFYSPYIYIAGIAAVICGELYILLIERDTDESRLPWSAPVIIIPFAIIMKDYLRPEHITIVYTSLAASLLLSILDVYINNNILGIYAINRKGKQRNI